MTQSKPKKVILENDPLYKEKYDWAQRFKNLIGKNIQLWEELKIYC